jgi:hypothetical protein
VFKLSVNVESLLDGDSPLSVAGIIQLIVSSSEVFGWMNRTLGVVFHAAFGIIKSLSDPLHGSCLLPTSETPSYLNVRVGKEVRCWQWV